MTSRGTAFFDDTIRDVSFALRTFRRTPLVALTIVSTVALGLGLLAAAFTLLNALVFRADEVPAVHEMFGVVRPRTSDADREPFTRAEFEALRRETDVFTDAYAVVGDVDSHVDGRTIFGTFVTGNYFQVLRVEAAIGRVLSPTDDVEARPVVVLSHRGWDRFFGRDPAVLGRRLVLNKVTFEIVGVMPEGFRGLTFEPDDYWAPVSTIGHVRTAHRGAEAGLALGVVGRLKPGLSRESAVAQLAVWQGRQSAARGSERGAVRITLVARDGTLEQPLEAVPVTAPLFFAFGLVLLIGCANVANLLLAKAVARQREFGLRLSLGATRRRLVRQLLTESLLLACVAAMGAFAVSRVALDASIGAILTSLPPDIGDIRLRVPDADWRVGLFLFGGACVSTMLFGLFPALQATRVQPVTTMRGEIVAGARPGRARHLLLGLQVAASAVLLISAAIFLRSAIEAASYDPGVRTADNLLVQLAGEPNRVAVVQALTAEPLVAEVAAVGDLAPRQAMGESRGSKARVAYRFVSPEYFSVLGVRSVRGRTFTPAERASTAAVAVVSESAARALWGEGNAIEQPLRVETGAASAASDAQSLARQTWTVVGVVRDVAGFRFAPFEKAVVYLPTSAEAPGTSFVVRVRGEPELARQALLDRVAAIDPDMARNVSALRTLARADATLLEIAFWLTIVLAALALVLTVSGLFSVLSYLVEQRTREIGVRMALGATTRDVTRLVLRQSVAPIGLGLLVGGSFAAAIAAVLLATPAAAGVHVGDVVNVLDPVAYGLTLIVIVAACLTAASIPAMRAARLNPTRALRQD